MAYLVKTSPGQFVGDRSPRRIAKCEANVRRRSWNRKPSMRQSQRAAPGGLDLAGRGFRPVAAMGFEDPFGERVLGGHFLEQPGGAPTHRHVPRFAVLRLSCEDFPGLKVHIKPSKPEQPSTGALRLLLFAQSFVHETPNQLRDLNAGALGRVVQLANLHRGEPDCRSLHGESSMS